jgi:hypothetical protein
VFLALKILDFGAFELRKKKEKRGYEPRALVYLSVIPGNFEETAVTVLFVIPVLDARHLETQV